MTSTCTLSSQTCIHFDDLLVSRCYGHCLGTIPSKTDLEYGFQGAQYPASSSVTGQVQGPLPAHYTEQDAESKLEFVLFITMC